MFVWCTDITVGPPALACPKPIPHPAAGGRPQPALLPLPAAALQMDSAVPSSQDVNLILQIFLWGQEMEEELKKGREDEFWGEERRGWGLC